MNPFSNLSYAAITLTLFAAPARRRVKAAIRDHAG